MEFESSCTWQCTGFVPSLIGGPDVGNGIAVDRAGNAYITGTLTPAPGTTTAFVAKFTQGCIWSCTGFVTTLVGGPDVGNGIALDIEGRAFVTGALSNAASTTNAYVAQFDPSCNWQCTGLLPTIANGRMSATESR